MSTKISGSKYAAMYGPTTGDKVRLADTKPCDRGRKRLYNLWRRSKVRRRQDNP